MNNNQKVESILSSLDEIGKSAPQSFFFTRLEARMNKQKNQAGSVVRFITRPGVAVAAVMIIILLNTYAIFFSARAGTNDTNNATEIASVDEYEQLSFNFYDSENSNP